MCAMRGGVLCMAERGAACVSGKGQGACRVVRCALGAQRDGRVRGRHGHTGARQVVRGGNAWQQANARSAWRRRGGQWTDENKRPALNGRLAHPNLVNILRSVSFISLPTSIPHQFGKVPHHSFRLACPFKTLKFCFSTHSIKNLAGAHSVVASKSSLHLCFI